MLTTFIPTWTTTENVPYFKIFLSNACISIISKKNYHNDSFTFCKYIRIFRLNCELPLTLPQLLGLFYAHTKELNFGHGPIHARVAITNAIIIGFSMVRISNSISSIHLLVWTKVFTFNIKSERIIYTDREILGEIIEIRGELLTVNFLLMMDNRGIIYL